MSLSVLLVDDDREVREALATWLKSEDERLDGIHTFRLTQRNRSHS